MARSCFLYVIAVNLPVRIVAPVHQRRGGTDPNWDAATRFGGVAPIGRDAKPNGQNLVGPLHASWRISAVGGIQVWANSSGRWASSQATLLLLHLSDSQERRPRPARVGLQADIEASLPSAQGASFVTGPQMLAED